MRRATVALLIGTTATVNVLLEAGADPDAMTNYGMTPLQLAKALGWDKVVALLERKSRRTKAAT
jgi:ankyrin repeat protein